MSGWLAGNVLGVKIRGFFEQGWWLQIKGFNQCLTRDLVDECSRILPASRYSLEILPTYPSNQLIFIHGKLGEIT